MINRKRSAPGGGDLLAQAVVGERSLHLLSLHLGQPEESVEVDIPCALLRSLEHLPDRIPLRRANDRAVLEAVRGLLFAFPRKDRRRLEVQRLLSDGSRRASSSHWPGEVWCR